MPESVDPALVYAQIDMERRLTKRYYDRGAHSLPELYTGDPVRLLEKEALAKHSWVKGQCASKVGPRFYLVEKNNGVYRRNSKWLRLDPYQPVIPEEVQEEIDESTESVRDSTYTASVEQPATPQERSLLT